MPCFFISNYIYFTSVSTRRTEYNVEYRQFIKEHCLFLIQVYCHLHFGIEAVAEVTKVDEKLNLHYP
jgi:hypothetical protein